MLNHFICLTLFALCDSWRYKHLGQFAPLGGEQTAAQLPGDWVSIGHSSQWLWYSVYARYLSHSLSQMLPSSTMSFNGNLILTLLIAKFSKQVSWRTRMLVISDWTRRFVFGRDSSRIWSYVSLCWNSFRHDCGVWASDSILKFWEPPLRVLLVIIQFTVPLIYSW